MTTTPEAVQTIADTMAEIERRAWHNVRDSRQLKDKFKAIADGGSVPVLKVSRFHAELVALTTSHSAALLDLHDRMTDVATECGIDLPPVTPGEGEIGVLSGGGR